MDKTALYARDVSGLTWRKSSKSDDHFFDCVEVADLGDGAVALRDSNNPAPGPTFDSLRRSGRPS
jgi:hypothetical protein